MVFRAARAAAMPIKLEHLFLLLFARMKQVRIAARQNCEWTGAADAAPRSTAWPNHLRLLQVFTHDATAPGATGSSSLS